MKHKHKWITWKPDDGVGWYRKCAECGQMERTSSDEGFTKENGFDE